MEQIQNIFNAEEGDIVDAALIAVAGIRELDRFGPGVATRFLTLACPDRLVSVNGPSAVGLGAIAGMEPDEGYLANNYDDLLRALHDREWFRAPEPDNVRDREIWHCRVALADAFVYIPLHKEA